MDKYKIIEELGEGGFATVYLAQDTHSNHQVALKVLSPDKVQQEGPVKRFKREAKALAQLSHNNIIKIYEAYEVDGKFYIAMEYLAGGSLQDLIIKHDTYLPTGQVITFLEQLASALDYAHSHNMIHRDIKPNNILLDDAENPQRVVLTDFGLVKPLATSEALTDTGIVLGTFSYMAPEQFDANQSGRLDQSTEISTQHRKAVLISGDIYSLSVVAYQMFTGELPSPFMEPRNPIDLNPALSQTIAKALLQGLAKTPEDRPDSVGDFVSMLKVGRKPHILVVDDDKNMRLTIRHILRDRYTAELANGIDQALEKLSRERFDLIVVDLNMESDERAGFKLLDKINQRHKQSQLLKIILTSQVDKESLKRAYRYDVKAYVEKGLNMERELLDEIDVALNK